MSARLTVTANAPVLEIASPASALAVTAYEIEMVLSPADPATLEVSAEGTAIALVVSGESRLDLTAASPATLEITQAGAPGPAGTAEQTWETFAKNLGAYPFAIAYTGGGDVSTVTYTTPAGEVVKTLGYSAGDLTSIVMSGAGYPGALDTTKTLTYSSGDLVAVSYS
jgi:hypothetical protein